jgi:hypothetical protein
MKQKLLIFIFVVTVSNPTWGQDVIYNFEIEDKEIIWRKVIETGLTFEQLVEKIKNSGLLEKMELGDNKLTGDIKDLSADFKGAGFSEMGTPIYVARSHFSAFTILEYKEGKYRVTLKKIILTQKYDDGLSKQGERTNLDVFALKTTKDELKGAFKKSPSLILDYTFTDKFIFKDTPTKKDW